MYYQDNDLYPRFLDETADNSFSNATDVIHLEGEEEGNIMPYTAMLFPWFFQLVGIFAFFILSRYLRFLPYTAVLFLLGVCAGEIYVSFAFLEFIWSLLILTLSAFHYNTTL